MDLYGKYHKLNNLLLRLISDDPETHKEAFKQFQDIEKYDPVQVKDALTLGANLALLKVASLNRDTEFGNSCADMVKKVVPMNFECNNEFCRMLASFSSDHGPFALGEIHKFNELLRSDRVDTKRVVDEAVIAGGHLAIAKAMHTHRDVIKIQIECCLAFLPFVRNGYSEEVLAIEGDILAIEAMRHHKSIIQVYAAGCKLLKNLSIKPHQELADRLVRRWQVAETIFYPLAANELSDVPAEQEKQEFRIFACDTIKRLSKVKSQISDHFIREEVCVSLAPYASDPGELGKKVREALHVVTKSNPEG